jgi:hypothetical protein
MADMRRTLKVIHFASQLCGISPYGSFLRNDGYEKPVLCRKYLVYSFIVLVVVSVGQLHFTISQILQSTNVISAAYSFNFQIMLIFVSSIFATYLISTITRLIGVRNFFKISLKLLSVGSFVNYHETTIFSNCVIALHVVLFITNIILYSFSWINKNCLLGLLDIFISAVICDTVTSFSAVQFLYFVFTLRRHFMLLNSSLNEVVMSTVKCGDTFSLKFLKVSDFLPKRNSIVSCVRDILHHHLMLCDILELIDSSYSLQVLAFIGSKFVHATIYLYLLFLSMFDLSFFPADSFFSLLPHLSYLVIQLVSAVYCCKSASFQVGII